MTDFALGDTIDIKFTTRQFSTGAPFTLAGTPVVSAYPDNSTTQITAGITLSVDFDTVTGLNNVRVVATSGNGYAAGTSYALVITTGTVDSVSVVGEVIGSFTLERGAAFGRLGAPAGASVSADIAAIEAQTDDIGAAGAGLTAVPWNSDWDAEVQSEVADALAAYDPPTKAETDALLTTALTESYAANGAAPTVSQALLAIHQMLMQFAISGTSVTVKQLDNSTTAFVVTLDDATNPTSAVRT